MQRVAQVWRHGGISGPCHPKSLLVPPPKRELCPPSEDCAPKKSNRPGAIGVHFRACAPPKNCLCHPIVSKIFVPGRKKRLNAKTEPKILRRKPLFWSSPLNLWSKSEIRTIKSRRTRQAINVPPPSKTCASNEGKRPEWRPFFSYLVFFPEDEVKFICAPPDIFLPPPPPVTPLWRRAWCGRQWRFVRPCQAYP